MASSTCGINTPDSSRPQLSDSLVTAGRLHDIPGRGVAVGAAAAAGAGAAIVWVTGGVLSTGLSPRHVTSTAPTAASAIRALIGGRPMAVNAVRALSRRIGEPVVRSAPLVCIESSCERTESLRVYWMKRRSGDSATTDAARLLTKSSDRRRDERLLSALWPLPVVAARVTTSKCANRASVKSLKSTRERQSARQPLRRYDRIDAVCRETRPPRQRPRWQRRRSEVLRPGRPTRAVPGGWLRECVDAYPDERPALPRGVGGDDRLLGIRFDRRESPTPGQIRASCRQEQNGTGLDLVIVDYMQRCTMNPSSTCGSPSARSQRA